MILNALARIDKVFVPILTDEKPPLPAINRVDQSVEGPAARRHQTYEYVAREPVGPERTITAGADTPQHSWGQVWRTLRTLRRGGYLEREDLGKKPCQQGWVYRAAAADRDTLATWSTSRVSHASQHGRCPRVLTNSLRQLYSHVG